MFRKPCKIRCSVTFACFLRCSAAVYLKSKPIYQPPATSQPSPASHQPPATSQPATRPPTSQASQPATNQPPVTTTISHHCEGKCFLCRKVPKTGGRPRGAEAFQKYRVLSWFLCARKVSQKCVQTAFGRHFLTFCCGGVPRSKRTCALFYAFLRAFASMGSTVSCKNAYKMHPRLKNPV